MIDAQNRNLYFFPNLDRLMWAWPFAVPFLVGLALAAGALDVGPGRRPEGPPRPAPFAAPALAPGGGAGEMILRHDGQEIVLPVQATEVQLQVAGMMVHGVTIQTFVNPTDRVIEAIYRFPLPEQATIHAMEMIIGSRRIVAVVREKEQADQIYQAAKAEGKKAAKVDQDRPNLFTTSAANINPGEMVVVRLEYLQELQWDDGGFRLVYPLTFTPRYKETGTVSADRAAMSSWVAPFVKMTVRLDAGLPMASVECLSHPVTTRWEGQELLVESPADGLEANRDFLLAWKPEAGAIPAVASFIEDREDGRYAMVMVVPPSEQFGEQIGLNTDTVFILDVSGSMDGPSIAAARGALASFLERLVPGDRFRILLFNDSYQWMTPSFLPADPLTIREAVRSVRHLAAGGGTDILGALTAGLASFRHGSEQAAAGHQRIVFLTDGAVSNEDEVFDKVTSDLGAIRLHVLGIGSAPNRHLMRKMARFGRGLCVFIPEAADAEDRIDRFLARIGRPVMTNLSLDWGSAPDLGQESFPSPLPDLYLGEPLCVSVRLPDRSGDRLSVSLQGSLDGGAVTLPAAKSSQVAAGVGVRWARARIDALMDQRFEGMAEEDVRSRVIDVALAFDLVTRYTSLVAVDKTPRRDVSEALGQTNVPGLLPAGTSSQLAGLQNTATGWLTQLLLSLFVLLLASSLLWFSGSRLPVAS